MRSRPSGSSTGLLADRDTLEQASLWNGGERMDRQIEQGLQSALKTFRPSTLPAVVGALLTPPEGATADKAALDLALLVESRDLTKAKLSSVFDAAIRSTAKVPAVRQDALAKLDALQKKHPADCSVQTAVALAAFAEDKPASIREAVDRLVKLVESTPLEPLPPSGKANARQRAEALAQVSLWLAARECLAKDREPYWQAGEKLAAPRVAAAKRQQDLFLAMAILREWGQMELDLGNKAKAEERWNELLELTVPKPACERRRRPRRFRRERQRLLPLW